MTLQKTPSGWSHEAANRQTASLPSTRRRVARLQLACCLAILLLPANASLLHTEHTRKRDAARPGTTTPHADPRMAVETGLRSEWGRPRWSLINDQGWAVNVDHPDPEPEYSLAQLV
jgi:hypothetical protein